MTTAPATTITRGPSRVVLGLSLLVVAANLRPTLTALGPVLGLVATDTGLTPSALGLLGALPLIAFAGVSPLVQLLSRRWGPDRTVLGATVVMLVATAVRSLPGPTFSLWAGTALLGASIAVCNVLVPALVKRDFPTEVPLMTGAYSSVLSGSAALASGLALPVAARGGWRLGIGIWGLVGVLALLAWWTRLRHRSRGARVVAATPPGPGPRMWRSALAWQVTAFMATQAATFYLLVTWLPTIERANGIPPGQAGWDLFLYQAAGIVAGLGVSAGMRGRRDHRLAGVVVSAVLVVAVLGLLLAPSWNLVWLVLAGLSGGSSLVIALALVGERARHPADAARLSGMVQSIGYLLAVAGPIGAGALFQLTGGWGAALLAVAGVGIVQLVMSLLAGRDAYV